MSSEDILIDISRESTRATVSKYFQQNVCGVKRARRTLYYRRRQPNIYIHTRERWMAAWLTASRRTALARFWFSMATTTNIGKPGNVSTLIPTLAFYSTALPSLLYILYYPLILFDRGFPFFIFLFNKRHNKPKRTRQMLILVAILQKALIDGQQIP